MFSSHPPSSSPHALEHRQQHSPPSPSSPLPTGECRFILLHPSIQNQRCSCQGFRLNRSIPGSSCECGHLACYHVPAATAYETRNLVSFTQHIALMEKVRKLEDELAETQRCVEDSQRAVEDVQRARADDGIATKETMRMFWRAMEKRLVEMDDKVEATLDMAHESREDAKIAKSRIESVEDSTMALEARLDTATGEDDNQSPKRRRTRKLSSSSASSTKGQQPPESTSMRDGNSSAVTSSVTQSPLLHAPTAKTPSPPRSTPRTHTHSRSPSAPPALNPASDFASPAESIKAFAPPHAKGSTLSRANTVSPFEPLDAPSPVDFLASIANMPMKRQIRELDTSTVEALGGQAGDKVPGKKRKRVPTGGSGGDIGAIKERLVSMPVGELSDGLESR